MKINPRIEIICVGTELLTSKPNTHAAYVGGALGTIGLTLAREHTVSDDPKMMREVFAEAWKRADVVICCGGLGPTFDDLTREVWARVTGRRLILQKYLLDEIREKFRRRAIPMPPHNRRQGTVLNGAAVIPNANGTAPGQLLRVGTKLLFLLPGPARELKPMLETFVLTQLKESFAKNYLVQRSFHFIGTPESVLDHHIRPLIEKYPRVRGCRVVYGILASEAVVSVKFTVDGKDEIAVGEAAEFLENKFSTLFKNSFFGRDSDTLPSVIGKWFQTHHKTVAVAESCTGGLIAKLLTDDAGASNYFIEGVTTYSNRSKMKRLNVQAKTLQKHGAVSEAVAREMARGLRQSTQVDYTLSVTGIAGPTGGTPEKPVGLVFVGCSGPRHTVVEKFQFPGDRAAIRQRAALMALELLRRELS